MGEEDEPRRSVRIRPIDADALAAIIERGFSLPEPLAAAALEIELGVEDGDETGVRKRCYELGIAVVRYAFSIGLAALARPGQTCDSGLGDSLRKAMKLTDGRWVELLRTIARLLKRSQPDLARMFAFGSASTVNELVASRNAFVHGGGDGHDASTRALAVLDVAKDLLAIPIHVARDDGRAELRLGVPKRAGAWKKVADDGRFASGEAYAALESGSFRVDPWLPLSAGALRLVDSPHAPGRRWRYIVTETGEHLEHDALDRAIIDFAGLDAAAPPAPNDAPALVGRSVEIALLQRAFREAAGGRIRVVVVTGAQGSGRTRLLQEASRAAGAFDFSLVLDAMASPERRTPFAALRLALANETETPFARALERLATTSIDGRARYDAEIEAIEETLVSAAQAKGILVLVDDAQWLDEHSLALLRLLTNRANRGASARLMVIVAVRHEGEPTSGLRDLLVQVDSDVGSGATRVPLGALSDTDGASLVKAIAPVTADVVSRVVGGAAGLPFYLVQPLLVWIETGTLAWQEGVYRQLDGSSSGAAIPGLAELVETRLRSYFDPSSDAEATALNVLAVLSADRAPTPSARLQRVLEELGADRELAERVLRTLCAAAVIEERRGHGLLIPQPIVAEALGARYRNQSWWRVAYSAWLEILASESESTRDAAAIARAFDSIGETERALSWYRTALAQYARLGAFTAAAALGEELALRETDPAARARAELAVVESLHRSGQLDAARDRLLSIDLPRDPAFEVDWSIEAEELARAAGRPSSKDWTGLVARADACGDVRLSARARLVVARSLRGAEGRQAIARALGALEAQDDAGVSDLRYRLLALDLELAYELRTDAADALMMAASRARSAARRIGSIWAVLDAENDLAILDADHGDLENGIAQLISVGVRAAEHHYGSLRRLALTNAAALELRRDRVERARELAIEVIDEARTIGDSRFLAVALSIRAETELLAGDAADALAAIDECLAIRERSGERATVVALLRRAEARARMGQSAEARIDAESALARAEEARNVDQVALSRLWLGVHDVKMATTGAPEALEALVANLESDRARLRPPTVKRLEEARALLVVR